MARASHPPTGLSLLTLGQILLCIGATAFGGRGAAPAVVGLLVVTALSLGRNAFVSEVHIGIAVVALALALWTKLHPIAILLGGAVIGAGYGLLKGIETL